MVSRSPEYEIAVPVKNRFGMLTDEAEIEYSDRDEIDRIASRDRNGACRRKRKREVLSEEEMEATSTEGSGENRVEGNVEETEDDCFSPMINSIKLRSERLLIVPVQLEESNNRALIDTGASNNLLSEVVVRQLNLTQRKGAEV